LIDVGVRGGIGEHWLHFGDHLHAWGFDPLYEEGVGPLIEANKHPERMHYLNLGLADEDGSRPFKFYADNPSSSHFVATNGTDAVDESWQMVTIRRLDSLVSDGTIGAIDFMKMDAETYEVEILRGALHFFATSGIFGVESETHFLRTQRNPRSHFVELYEQLAPYRFSAYDAGPHRVPRPPLVHGFPQEAEDGKYVFRPTGRAWIFDFLFLHESFDDAAQQKEISVDRLIKMIATAKTYGLQDVGLDILFVNQERLGRRFDVEEAADWLVREHGHSTLTYHQYFTGTIPVNALGVG
jgi:FkbM family methyltransferase